MTTGIFESIKIDNGTDPTIPTVPREGLINIMDHFRIFGDGDGDGDYDYDIWSKDNMYIVAEEEIHFRPNKTTTEQGRVVVGAKDGTNFVWSGRNYSGTTKNGLEFGPYKGTARWLYIDPTNGFVGIGLDTGDAPSAKLHVKHSGATNVVVESTGSTGARMGFKGTATSSASAVTVGADGNDLVLRANGQNVLRLRAPMPTSPAGLPTGMVYKDANGFLKIA